MRYRLDYPGINCRQCGKNYQTDGLEPQCDDCRVSRWDNDTIMAMACYAAACPHGQLDPSWLEIAIVDLSIPAYRQSLVRRQVLAIDHIVTEHYAESQQPGGD